MLRRVTAWGQGLFLNLRNGETIMMDFVKFAQIRIQRAFQTKPVQP